MSANPGQRMIFRFLLLCLLSFCLPTSQTVRNRESKFYEDSGLEEENQVKRSRSWESIASSTDSSAFTSSSSSSSSADSSVVTKRTSILNLPEAILKSIYSYVHDPGNEFSYVSRNFFRAWKLADEIVAAKMRFASQMDVSTLDSVKLARKLLTIDDNFFALRLEVCTTFDTYLGCGLPVVQERVISTLQRMIASNHPLAASNAADVFRHALYAKNFELAVKFIEIVPKEFTLILTEVLRFWNDFIYQLYCQSPELVQKLNSWARFEPILKALIVHPVPASFLLNLKAGQERTAADLSLFMFTTLAKALKTRKPEEDAERAAELFARNNEIIARVPVIDNTRAFYWKKLFEFFNNYLYNATFTRVEARIAVEQLITNNPADTLDARNLKRTCLASNLLHFAIVNESEEIIRYVPKSTIPDDLDLRPEFAAKLGFTAYKQIVGIRDPLKLVRFRESKGLNPITKVGRISKLGNSRLLAHHGSAEQFLTSLESLTDHALVTLLHYLIHDFEEPADMFVSVLQHLNLTGTFRVTSINSAAFRSIALGLKLFKSLLKAEHINLNHLPPFSIRIDSYFAEALISDPEIVSQAQTDRYKRLIRFLTLESFIEFISSDWTSERYVAFFKALHFPIRFRFSMADADAQMLIDRPTTYLTHGPEAFRIDILPCLALHVANNFDAKYYSNYTRTFLESAQTGGTPVRDPLLLRSFPLLNLWRLTDWESFFLNAPFVEAFHPSLDELMLTNYYRLYLSRPEFFNKVLSTYPGQQLNIRITSLSEARFFVLVVLSVIPREKWTQIKFHFLFDFSSLLDFTVQPAADGTLTLSANRAYKRMKRTLIPE